jgi:hypothetical protein
MKRRRSRVGIKVEPTPEPGPLRVHEQVQAAQRLMPKSNAHDVDDACPCLVCGGPAERSETHVGPWRRHRACEAVQAYPADRLEAAARALGRHLDRIDAQLLGFSVAPYSEIHPEPTWTDEPLRVRLPWRHVDREALDEAIGRLPELRVDAGLVDSPCVDGNCGWCGVREARGWASFGHTWADGTPAPLCGPCAAIFERTGRPDPAWWDAQRAGIAEAVSGVPVMLGETPPAGLRAFAEEEKARARAINGGGQAPINEPLQGPMSEPGTVKSDISEGDGTPWSHLPQVALEAYRWAVWGRWQGRYAPAEHRAEALARAEAVEAARAAKVAAEVAEESARLDVFGFTTAGGPR